MLALFIRAPASGSSVSQFFSTLLWTVADVNLANTLLAIKTNAVQLLVHSLFVRMLLSWGDSAAWLIFCTWWSQWDCLYLQVSAGRVPLLDGFSLHRRCSVNKQQVHMGVSVDLSRQGFSSDMSLSFVVRETAPMWLCSTLVHCNWERQH